MKKVVKISKVIAHNQYPKKSKTYYEASLYIDGKFKTSFRFFKSQKDDLIYFLRLLGDQSSEIKDRVDNWESFFCGFEVEER